MPYLSGAVDEPPTPYEVLIEAGAGRAGCAPVQQRDGEWVRLDELAEGQGGYDGAAFGCSEIPREQGREVAIH